MAGDLERFLQQAAERLRQKLEQANQPQPPARPPQPIRQAERARPVMHAEIVEEVVPASLVNPREAGPNPLSDIDTRPEIVHQFTRMDERMAGGRDTFEHSVARLKMSSSEMGDVSSEITQSAGVRVRSKQSSPFVEMLRKPESLRAAFLASEIFARRFG
jgi:hypothetical protein